MKSRPRIMKTINFDLENVPLVYKNDEERGRECENDNLSHLTGDLPLCGQTNDLLCEAQGGVSEEERGICK